ncbi:MAG: NAD(P)/FAD-dependent oxidoreductase [Bacteroidales bacterium]|nr:NAD(P)/FAD-dependent oxidoreductase [Bacteroidales bacterium]
MQCNDNINCYEKGRICVPATNLPSIVVIGGGFAGISFVKQLKNKAVQVILIDKENFHQFMPLLYQVATSGLEPDNIVFPFRKIYRNYKNVLFRMAEVIRVDTRLNKVETNIGTIDYDYLVIATGSVTNFFGNESVAKYGFGLKSVTDSLDIRSFLLQNLEKAVISCNEEERETLSSVAIVGGGPTGVEMAGALAEFRKYVLPKDYPELRNTSINIYLLEASGKLLQDMPEKLSVKTLLYLQKLGVNVQLNTSVKAFDGQLVTLDKANVINAATLIWTAGIKGNVPVGLDSTLLNKQNRIMVDQRNRLIGYDNVFAIGDVAAIKNTYPNGHPMVAQVAIQQGRKLADNLMAIINDKPLRNFEYRDKGSMATIGKKKAVAAINNRRFSGFFAWLLWSFVHLMSIMGIRNKLLIAVNWIWSYFTYDKGDRVIIRSVREERKAAHQKVYEN